MLRSRKFIFIIILAILTTAYPFSLYSQSPPKPPSGPAITVPPGASQPGPPPGPFPGVRQPPPAIEKVSPGIFKIGDIQIDKKNRNILFPAKINMDKGLLEYLLVRSSGKVHESVLRTDIDPYDLQIAFLLLGFEGSDKPLQGQGDPDIPKGEAVEITITYNWEGKGLSVKPEEWLSRKMSSNGSFIDLGTMNWVYTGSVIIGGRFMAQIGGSIIAIYHDPDAMIDNASPGGESDKIWFVKEGKVPPIGTPVMITIKVKK
jgi:hypothetical protein